MGCDVGERYGIKNFKICLAHITFSARTVPNITLSCTSMLIFLAFITFGVRGFLVFDVLNAKILTLKPK